MTIASDYSNPKAQEFLNQAAKHQRDREESWARSDTDGSISQWASGKMSQLTSLKAKVAAQGDRSVFWGLYEGDRRVKAQQLEGQYGWYWLLHEDETALIAKRGKPYLPTGPKSRVHKKLGLREAREAAPAEAFMDGHGTGLSGSCWASTRRTGDRWGQDSVLLPPEEA